MISILEKFISYYNYPYKMELTHAGFFSAYFEMTLLIWQIEVVTGFIYLLVVVVTL